jgi:integrase
VVGFVAVVVIAAALDAVFFRSHACPATPSQTTHPKQREPLARHLNTIINSILQWVRLLQNLLPFQSLLNVSLYQVPEEFMGHSSIQITFDRYGHLLEGSRGEAVERADAYLSAAQ